MSLQPDKQVRQYVITNLLAEGSMGVVWHARHETLNKSVVIKAIPNDLIADQSFRLRLQGEARRNLRLTHPNIVPVMDVFEFENSICIVTALVKGQSLSDILGSRMNKPLNTEEAIPIAIDILLALDYAHKRGVVHRDVKPSKILVDQHNRALLIDFGIGLAVGEERRTRMGRILGTPEYMSPEQITKPQSIDHRSDIYSVGCVFYEMLAGRPPFVRDLEGVGGSDYSLMQAHVNKRPVPPASLVPSIPADFDELIMRALEKEPNDRIPGCSEFLRLLDRASIASSMKEQVDTWSPTKRMRLFRLPLTVGLLLLLLVALVWLFLY